MSRYGELTAKVDAFFARVHARHADDMQCGSGCSDCCDVRLTITTVEADAIRAALASWPADRRAALADHARTSRACAALKDGRCLIYDVRPVVCRSHGAPIRVGTKRLPVLQNCHRNFTRITPDQDCVLDQELLSALVLAVNAGDDTRVDLASLLSSAP